MIALLGFSAQLKAQNGLIDDLLDELETTEYSEQRVDVLNKLSYEFYPINIENNRLYAQEALDLADSLDYQKGIARAKNYLGIYYAISGDIEQAQSLNKESVVIAKEIGDDVILASAYNDLGILSMNSGQGKQAMEYYHMSLEYAEETEDVFSICLAHNNLGNYFLKEKDLTTAQRHLERILDYRDVLLDESLLANSLASLGRVMIQQVRFMAAEEYFNEALEISKRVGDLATQALSYSGLSMIHDITHENAKAISMSEKAVSIAESLGDKEILIEVYIEQFHILVNNQRLDEALLKSERLFGILDEMAYYPQACELHKTVSTIYRSRKAYNEAYRHLSLYVNCHDSLDIVESRRIIQELDRRYRSEKNESENKLLRAQQEKNAATIHSQKLFNYMLASLALLMFAIGSLIYVAYAANRDKKFELEEKVKSRTLELERANKELTRSNEELERFAYITSHDLKQPLQTIINFSNLLEKKMEVVSEGENKRYFNFIKRGASQMFNLIEDVLDYSRLGQEEKDYELVDLDEMVDEVLFSLGKLIDDKKADIRIDKPLGLMKYDRSRLFLLFKNLIENGLKYNVSEAPYVHISKVTIGQVVRLVFSDNGIGIKEEYKHKIFKMFSRLQNNTEYEGTGLGLSLCKKILTSLGGSINVESTEGKGSDFIVTIPEVFFIKEMSYPKV